VSLGISSGTWPSPDANAGDRKADDIAAVQDPVVPQFAFRSSGIGFATAKLLLAQGAAA
jgi:hypothetical protein